jgi:hypothetical protein
MVDVTPTSAGPGGGGGAFDAVAWPKGEGEVGVPVWSPQAAIVPRATMREV